MLQFSWVGGLLRLPANFLFFLTQNFSSSWIQRIKNGQVCWSRTKISRFCFLVWYLNLIVFVVDNNRWWCGNRSWYSSKVTHPDRPLIIWNIMLHFFANYRLCFWGNDCKWIIICWMYWLLFTYTISIFNELPIRYFINIGHKLCL